MDLSNKKALVIDQGLFVGLAVRLSRDFAKVGYFIDWTSGFPDGRELVIGEGIPGVERVKYLWDVIDDYDIFIFADVWQGDLQEHLRKLGKRVWGTGHASWIELSRWRIRSQFPELGLDENPTTQVNGTQELRKFLATHENQFIKISAYRGIGETWFAENLQMAEFQIREIEYKLGAMANVIRFICEDAIPGALEVGYDGYCIDGEFPDSAVVGVEIKDQAYFGEFRKYDQLPKNVREVNAAMAQILSQFQYRQFFSTEIREKAGKSYLIDTTARHASPAGEIYCEMFDNLAEIIWQGADGILVNPKIKDGAKYGAQIILTSEWYALSNWQPIQFPEEVRPYLKLYYPCRIEGMDYCVPQVAHMKQLGSVIATGSTPDAAIKLCKERAEQIKGFDLDIEADALDKALEEMKKV